MSIEIRSEVPREKDVDYAARTIGTRAIGAGKHRKVVGGRWDEMGQLQLDFLREHGLRPEHRFLDVGCGALRAGRLLATYLAPGHYYGIDVNASLVSAGYEHELTEEARGRLPASNLRVTDRFDADFGTTFDMALAQSVFSHLPLTHLRLCLARLAPVVAPGGTFWVTYFEQPADFPVDGVRRDAGRLVFSERNFFWYYRRDLEYAAQDLPWRFTAVGDWGHPRGQVMGAFVHA
jgi:SAM-dependent methyltransferase